MPYFGNSLSANFRKQRVRTMSSPMKTASGAFKSIGPNTAQIRQSNGNEGRAALTFMTGIISTTSVTRASRIVSH